MTSTDDAGDADDISDIAARIRETVAEELERGALPDPAALRSRFPDSAVAIERVLLAASRLRSLESMLAAAPRALPELPTGTELGDFTLLGPLGGAA